MPEFPKLIINGADPDLVWYIFSRGDNLVVIEGQAINSYDDFITLCTQEPLKNKEVLKIQLLRTLSGG
ncbi:hypothetical protein ACFLTP_06620 [Chloroflexota bacterium]